MGAGGGGCCRACDQPDEPPLEAARRPGGGAALGSPPRHEAARLAVDEDGPELHWEEPRLDAAPAWKPAPQIQAEGPPASPRPQPSGEDGRAAAGRTSRGHEIHDQDEW